MYKHVKTLCSAVLFKAFFVIIIVIISIFIFFLCNQYIARAGVVPYLAHFKIVR